MAQDTGLRAVDNKALPRAEVELFDLSDQEIQIDCVMETSITKKFDQRIVPWLFGLWLLAFIDRSNIGNARIDGLSTDLNLGTGPKYNTALAIFYVPYICVDVPSNWLIKRAGAGYYLPGLVIGWGIVSIGIGFVKTYQDLLAVRSLLGIFEGGLLGGMILYLSMFYRRHQLMRRIGLFYCAAPLSGAFGGLLATGLSQINTSGYRGWQVSSIPSAVWDSKIYNTAPTNKF
jgi:MFS family permease